MVFREQAHSLTWVQGNQSYWEEDPGIPSRCLLLQEQRQPCPAQQSLQLTKDAQAILSSLSYLFLHAKVTGTRNATVQASLYYKETVLPQLPQMWSYT